jgi:hypothetical protein
MRTVNETTFDIKDGQVAHRGKRAVERGQKGKALFP